MSLGFARDSILNLAQLAHKEEEREWQFPTETDDDDFLLFDEEEEEDTSAKNEVTQTAGKSYSKELPKSDIEAAEEKKEEKQFEDEPTPESPTKTAESSMYSGFSSDYHAYEDYYNESMMYNSYQDPYAASYGFQNSQEKKKNVFCCLMPWLQNEDDFASDDENDHSQAPSSDYGVESETKSTVANGEPPVETINASEKGDTLNKLRSDNLSCDQTGIIDKHQVKPSTTPGDFLADKSIELPGAKAAPKGILKNKRYQSTVSRLTKGPSFSENSTTADTNVMQRRMLFPAYEPKNFVASDNFSYNSEASQKNVTFSPMARVTTINARKDMTFMERSKVWWQRSDYEDFKKTGRIIAKAMLEGGSEIWLQTSDAWGAKQHANKNTLISHSDEYRRALREYSGSKHELDDESHSAINEDKWWCKFGHSRRGLEHVVTVEEGRQRQKNVNMSHNAVMDEQRRQRMTRTKDVKKLAQVYANYTHWARDLAIASGSADAHAVRSNFNQDYKNRTYFLRQSKENASSKQCSLNEPSLVAILDANTPTNIILRQQEQIKKEYSASKASKPTNKLKDTESSSSKENTVGNDASEDGDSSMTAIHDPLPSQASIAKKAAGFSADGDNDMKMSAVLSGLGGVNTNMAQTVGAH